MEAIALNVDPQDGTADIAEGTLEVVTFPFRGGLLVFNVQTNALLWLDRKTFDPNDHLLHTLSQRATRAPEMSVRTGLPPLTSACLNVSNDCNLSCQYCYGVDGYMRSGGRMRPETARRAVDLLCRGAGRRTISFFGGEPLLAFDAIRAAVQHAEQQPYDFLYAISTNGILIDASVARFFARHSFRVALSLDGDAAVHDRMRTRPNGRGSHSETIRGLEQLRQQTIEPRILVVLTRDTISRAEAILSYLRNLGLQDLFFSTVREQTAHAITTEQMPLLRSFVRRVARSSLAESLTIGVGGSQDFLEGLQKRQLRRFGCESNVGACSITVSPRGDLYPCHPLIDEAHRLGDLSRPPSESWRRPYLEAHVDARDCSTCWARYLCGGGCPAEAIAHTGDIRHVLDRSCAVQLAIIEESLFAFAEHQLSKSSKRKWAVGETP